MLLNFKSDSYSRYAELMENIFKEDFSYLLTTVAYDQSKFSGPPRSVPEKEIERLFGNNSFFDHEIYSVTTLNHLFYIGHFCDITILEKLFDTDGCDIITLLKRKTIKS